MVHVLVTGARGFVGRRLVPRLLADGARVTAIDCEVDVTRPGELGAVLLRARPDAVVHLAAQSSEADSARVARDTYHVNFGGALALLRGVERAAPRARVVLVGSGIAYGAGPPGTPALRETAPLRPDSPYARSKAAADLLGACFAARGLGVVRARPFNHSGPGQADHFAVPSFARQLAEIEAGRREPRIAVGNLESIRDWLHVDDVVDAYVRLLDAAVPPDAYNIASGRGAAVGELLERLLARARTRVTVEVDPERVRPTDSLVGDATRLGERAGWRPRAGLDRMLDEILAAQREAVGAA